VQVSIDERLLARIDKAAKIRSGFLADAVRAPVPRSLAFRLARLRSRLRAQSRGF